MEPRYFVRRWLNSRAARLHAKLSCRLGMAEPGGGWTAMDAAGVLVPLPDRRTVSVRRAEFDPLLGGRRKRAWGPSNGLMGPSAASHNRSGHQLNQRAVVGDEHQPRARSDSA